MSNKKMDNVKESRIKELIEHKILFADEQTSYRLGYDDAIAHYKAASTDRRGVVEESARDDAINEAARALSRLSSKGGRKKLLQIAPFRSNVPKNDKWLVRIAGHADLVIAAWGTHGQFLGRSTEVMKILPVTPKILRQGKFEPWHPLYLPDSTDPLDWEYEF